MRFILDLDSICVIFLFFCLCDIQLWMYTCIIFGVHMYNIIYLYILNPNNGTHFESCHILLKSYIYEMWFILIWLLRRWEDYRLVNVQISFKISTCNVLVLYMCTSLYISIGIKECVWTGCTSVYISTCTKGHSAFLPYILSTLKNSSCEDKTKNECVWTGWTCVKR